MTISRRPGGYVPPGPTGPPVSGLLTALAFAPLVLLVGLAGWVCAEWGWTAIHARLVAVALGVVLAIGCYPIYCWMRSFWIWAEMSRALYEAGVGRATGRIPRCMLVTYWRGKATIRLSTLRHSQHDFDEVPERFCGWLGEVVEVGEVGRGCTIRTWRRSAHRDKRRPL